MSTFYGTIIDLGVSEGNDTAFYLQKGFRVLAVEADLEMCQRLRSRFEIEIAAGALKLLNFAASDTFGDLVPFYVHETHQGVSGVAMNSDLPEKGYRAPSAVQTIDWQTLLTLGRPHYVKIDIENNEDRFLVSMAKSSFKPQFISVECHNLKPVNALYTMGYRRFKLVNQNAKTGFVLPPIQLEGRPVAKPNFAHASGPFGLDVFASGDWTDFEAFTSEWKSVQPRRAEGIWFDCHAWKPEGLLNFWRAKLAVSAYERPTP